jgi:hypothetical protein
LRIRRQPAIVIAALMFCRNVLADSPATRPSPLDQQMRAWIRELGVDDSQVRQSALSQLMWLREEDLPALREAALSLEPLLPGQIAAIHDAVTQIYLEHLHDADAPADNNQPTRGFLGLRWSQKDTTESSPDGVIVAERIPGFGAYRMLQSGDIIVKILDQPDVELHNDMQFMDAVRPMLAGQILHLRVMRYGRLMDISVPMEPLPADLPAPTFDPDIDVARVNAWAQARDEKAQAFWQQEFSVIDPARSSSSASTEP